MPTHPHQPHSTLPHRSAPHLHKLLVLLLQLVKPVEVASPEVVVVHNEGHDARLQMSVCVCVSARMHARVCLCMCLCLCVTRCRVGLSTYWARSHLKSCTQRRKAQTLESKWSLLCASLSQCSAVPAGSSPQTPPTSNPPTQQTNMLFFLPG